MGWTALLSTVNNTPATRNTTSAIDIAGFGRVSSFGRIAGRVTRVAVDTGMSRRDLSSR